MNIEQATEKFIVNPAYLRNGAGFLASSWECTKEDIYEAKERARTHFSVTVEESISSEKVDGVPVYIGSDSTTDSIIKRFQSNKPLSPKEIEELAGVDGITTEIARVWDKLQTNGMWTYSIDIRYKAKDFYNKEELRKRLAEIFPDVTPYSLPIIKSFDEKALVICVADDHVGAVNITDLYDNSKLSYKDRLTQIVKEVLSLGRTFEEVIIVSLGDQLNGWNSNTTRGGHEVKSLSNKDQFDLYTEARVNFYNELFSSGVGAKYSVFDVENSNHSGLGFSYMANQYLDMYLQAKFPQVIRESAFEAVDGFTYGGHVILLAHGKDEKFMKKPMPAVLTAQTDLFIYDYIQSKGISPHSNPVTLYKGDLHQHGIQMGKFGRYVNVQSIAGNSDYGDLNFGNTKAGALLEIYDKHSYRISSQPIWF